MLEGHEIEIYKLSGWPYFPVSFHNVKIACLQILFNILQDEMHYCHFLYRVSQKLWISVTAIMLNIVVVVLCISTKKIK